MEVSTKRDQIAEECMKFKKLHGFTPTSAHISRVVGCSREYVRHEVNAPLTDTSDWVKTNLGGLKVPEEINDIIRTDMWVYNISYREALQSYLFEVLGGINGKE